MPETLLNVNQRRRVATFLQLLAEDVAHMKRQDALPMPVRDQLDALDECAQQIQRDLALPPPREMGPLYRVRVLADVWAMRAHDLHAARLRGYGAVHPDLAARLDPLVDRMQSCLRDLAEAATAPQAE